MHSGVPTVLIYKEEYYELIPIFEELMIKLKMAGIVFTDPVEAAKHINSISSNPEKWWNREKTEQAKNMFFKFCGIASHDPLSEWVDFFKKL